MSISNNLMLVKGPIFIIFCLMISNHAYCLQPRVSQSTISNFLRQPTVTAVHRDKEGILWIGTQHDLHRFDGSNHTIFSSDPDNPFWIPNSDVKDIAEDRNGDLLVATSSGTIFKSYWNLGELEFKPQLFKADRTGIVSLFTTLGSDIWVLSHKGVFTLESRSSPLSELIGNKELIRNIGNLNSIVEGMPGNIIVGGDQGLAIFNLGENDYKFYTKESLSLPENARITALEIDENFKLFIGTSTGNIALLNLITGTTLGQSTTSSNRMTLITELLLHRETLFIATDMGLFASSQDLSNIHNLGKSGGKISNPDIYTLLEDGRYVWVGTGNGLDIISLSAFDLLSKDNSGVYNDVLAITEDSSEQLWIGTYDGLFRYNNKTERHERIEPTLDYSTIEDDRVTTIYPQGNKLWLGYLRGGVRLLDTDTGSSLPILIGDSNSQSVTKILGEKNSQDIWISTYNEGMIRISEDRIRSYYEDLSFPEESITQLYITRDNDVIAISNSRIYRYNQSTDGFDKLQFEFVGIEFSPNIYSLSQNYRDDLLLGTNGHGAFIWKRQDQLEQRLHLHPIDEEGSLSSSIVYGIEIDTHGNIWCSTQNGIVKLDPDGKFIKKFTTIDGLQGNDFNFGASFTGSDGLIYFGGVNGYNRFNPDEVEIDQSASPMRLTNVFLPGGDFGHFPNMSNISTLELSHEDKSVTFQFSVLDFVHPEKNQFRYMLKNFDSDWTESGTRNETTYTNLPSGNYVFRVQGANSAGIWNREGIALNVHVPPPPWFSWWAMCLYVVTFLFTFWCGHRIYRSYMLDKLSEEMAFEMIEAENRADDEVQEHFELHDELVQSAYDHSRRTLSLVGNCIDSQTGGAPGNNHVARASMKRISALSTLEDCLYYHGGSAVADLKKFADSVFSQLLPQCPASPDTVIFINEATPRLISAELASPIAIILYELLDNCILHAFDGGSPANYIHVKLDPAEDRSSGTRSLELFVGDSGRSLPASPEDLVTGNSGLTVVQTIVDNLDGSLKLKNEKGAKLSITIPVGEDHEV